MNNIILETVHLTIALEEQCLLCNDCNLDIFMHTDQNQLGLSTLMLAIGLLLVLKIAKSDSSTARQENK